MFRRKKTQSRRSHTTEYSKQPVFSYRSSRKGQERSFDRGRAQVPNTRRSASWWLKRSPYIVCGIVLLAVFFRSFLLDTTAQLDIVGSGAYLRDRDEYQASINDKLKSSPFYRFRPTLNSEKLSSQIESQFPELQEVVISVPMFSHRPVVEFVVATPAALITSNNSVYVIDGDGRVLFNQKDAYDSSKIKNLPLVNDVSKTTITIGKPALSSTQVEYVRQVYLQAAARGEKVSSIELQPGGTEIWVRFNDAAYFVKFNLNADARQSVGTYFAVSEKLKGEGATPKEYIDVRVPERAFVK